MNNYSEKFDEYKPLVSIVTVVFNAESTIERTIQSVIRQEYDHIEYIVIDGGSTDGTLEIIEKYKDQIYYYHSEKDKGIYDAMNKGIEIATGDYIGLINADDWLQDNAIKDIADAIMKNNRIEIYHANMNHVRQNIIREIKPTKNLGDFFWKGMSYMHPTFYVKREVYEHVKFDIDYKILADYKFTMECLQQNYTFFWIDKILVNYSAGGASDVFWQRIREGHNIRLDLGYSPYKVYASSMLRISLTIASKIKNLLKGAIKWR